MPGPYATLLTQIASDASAKALVRQIAGLSFPQLTALLTRNTREISILLREEDPSLTVDGDGLVITSNGIF